VSAIAPLSEAVAPLSALDQPSADQSPATDESPAADVGVHGWSLADLEALALAHNPAIQQAAASVSKALGYQDQVGRKPNPSIGYNGTQLADDGTDQHTVLVEQDIVLGDKLAWNQAVLAHEVQAQLWEVEAQRFRVLTDVRRRFYAALAAQQQVQLATEFHQIAERGVRAAEDRRKALLGTVPEVLQSEIQMHEVEIQRRRAEAAFQAAWRELMAVAGTPGPNSGTLIGDLPQSAVARDWDTAVAQVLSASPELQAARARVARAQAHLDRQQVQAVPNLSFLLAAGHDHSTGSGLINTQVSLPVPIFHQNEGAIAAAQAELCRSVQDVRRIELAIGARLARVAQEYDAAAAAVTQYQDEIVPRAAESLRLVEQAYTAGEFDFLQVLVARRTFFEAKLASVSARSELAAAGALIDGLLLSDGLGDVRDTDADTGLRDQALSGQ
jgi:cobalt-zinc-cadmium efflux system outer membrane protein